MTIQVYTDNECLEHKLFPFFAERPERLSVLQTLFNEMGLPVRSALPVAQADLLRAHEAEYVAHIKAVSEMPALIAPFAQVAAKKVQWYTRISPGSYDAACRSAGLVTQAVDDVVAGRVTRAFCAGRPPGHHAGPDSGEGFCLFSNVAIGALAALDRGVGRVAVVDFDRHHGNGTQLTLLRDGPREDVLFVSSYQEGCKYSGNVVRHNPYLVSVPIPVGSSFARVCSQYYRQVVPALKAFKPDLLMISAGFDLHKSDPLSSVQLESKDYLDLTNMVIEAASSSKPNLPVISVLEGGYDLKALRECVGYHLKALMP